MVYCYILYFYLNSVTAVDAVAGRMQFEFKMRAAILTPLYRARIIRTTRNFICLLYLLATSQMHHQCWEKSCTVYARLTEPFLSRALPQTDTWNPDLKVWRFYGCIVIFNWNKPSFRGWCYFSFSISNFWTNQSPLVQINVSWLVSPPRNDSGRSLTGLNNMKIKMMMSL